MRELGLSFQVMKPDIDEKAVRDPDPMELPVVIALAKAKVRRRLPPHPRLAEQALTRLRVVAL